MLEPDEGRYAEIPREMLDRGDFVTPHLNGVVYLEKPPLFYWGNAVSFALFGESEFSARLFTATVSIAGVLLTYWMGAVLAGPRAGLFSAMVLCTSLYHYVIGRINTLDMTLAVTMIIATFPAFLYLSGKRESRKYLFLSYAGAALAFLAKGLIGIVFPRGDPRAVDAAVAASPGDREGDLHPRPRPVPRDRPALGSSSCSGRTRISCGSSSCGSTSSATRRRCIPGTSRSGSSFPS